MSTSKPIKSVTDRDRLAVRHEPYWHTLGTGRFVGVRKAADGIIWKARYYDPLTKEQRFTTLGDFSELAAGERFDQACAKAADWFRHVGAGGSTSEETVGDACDRYVRHLRATGKVKSGNDAEARFAAYVNPPPAREGVQRTAEELARDDENRRFARTSLRRLTPALVADWLVRLRERPTEAGPNRGKLRTAATLNRDMTPFRAALNLALEDKLVTTDEAWRKKLVVIKNADRRREGDALTPAQRTRFIKACPPDLAQLATAMALLPLRPGVLAACKVRDYKKAVRHSLPMLDLGRQAGVSEDKGHARMIPLSATAAAFFDELVKNKLPEAWLFLRADGKPWNKDAWKGPVKVAVRDAGLPSACTIYWLRHATITDLVSANEMDLNAIAKCAGTSVRMIEKTYAHLRGETTARGLELLALPGLAQAK